MKIFVINLQSRSDRRDHISKVLKGFDFEFFSATDGHSFNLPDTYNLKVFNQWVDPLIGRKITRGEIGTSTSHMMLWKKIADSDGPAIILEDDNIIVKNFDINSITEKMKSLDLLYLNYKEMVPGEVVDLEDPELIKPYYPYWASAYAITPEFSRHLLSLEFDKNIIPVDEFLPIVNNVDFNKYCLSDDPKIVNNFNHLKQIFYKKESKIAALKHNVFKQLNRSVFGTDTERQYEKKVYSLTVGTDESKMTDLLTSSKKQGIQFNNLGLNKVWNGGDMANSTGGGQKFNLVLDHLSKKEIFDDDIVLFCDGYDVFVNDNLDTIKERFLGFDCDVLVAAEKICWPDKSLESKFTGNTSYKYPNSGCYIGYKWAIKELIGGKIEDSADDQLHLQHRILKSYDEKFVNVKLDEENYLFQCVAGASDKLRLHNNAQLLNIETMTCPCILHGNGGPNDKAVFRNIFNRFNPEITLVPFTDKVTEVIPDILTGSFFTREQCQSLIQLAESNGNWKSLDYDKFPAQEIRIKTISQDLFYSIEKHIMDVIAPQIEKYWFPLLMHGVRDMFIIKYSPETQSSLSCHHDASLVSGIIKLNDDYEGGDTYFHRQDYSNKDIPLGDVILWPGQVTHGHEGKRVTSGTKYNLVIWTSRFQGDLNG